jgi:hypothetical protein
MIHRSYMRYFYVLPRMSLQTVGGALLVAAQQYTNTAISIMLLLFGPYKTSQTTSQL